MNRLKLWVTVSLVTLSVIVILQNVESVQAKLLFFSVTMPKAAMFFFAWLVGFMIGVLISLRLKKN